jgi:hypothetical protein
MLLLSSLLIFATQFSRNIEEKITILRDGTAEVVRTEYIPSSDLAKIFIEYFENMKKSREIFANYLYEVSKEYYFIYGTTPKFSSSDVKFEENSKGFTLTVKMKIPGIVRKDGNVLILSRKNFSDEKLLPKYFEEQIDGKIFESAFLQSEKNYLVTKRLTTIILPENSKIEDLKPIYAKKFDEKWFVDMGGGTTYKAHIEKIEKGVIIEEEIRTSASTPKNLLDEKNNIETLNNLRDYTAFQLLFTNEKMEEKLSQPVDHKIKNDFSGSWSFSVSSGELLSYTFTYGVINVTPKITVTLSFSASLLWEHQWVRTGWFSWSYKFKRFESTITFSPSLTPSITVQSGGSVSKEWSKNLFSKGKTVTFYVSCVPVILYMQAKLDAEAEASISASIGFTAAATFGLNTSLSMKYQNGWSAPLSYNIHYSGVSFTASAKANASAEGRLPFTLAAYVYYVAGPYVKLTPWIKGETNASVGNANQVSYSITGGIKAEGGVAMAGWLKNLCGNIPSFSYQFFDWNRTLASGTKTF